MKVLTLQQPFATAVMRGLRTVERRGVPLRYRGPLLIHAAAVRATARRCREYPELTPDALPYAAILGVVDVVGCVRARDGCGYEWYFADPRPLAEPFPCTGVGNLWEPPQGLALPGNGFPAGAEVGPAPPSV